MLSTVLMDAPSSRSCTASPLVILVDDDDVFRDAVAVMLADDGHAVRDFASPAAVSPLDELPEDAVLITDFEMPGQNGVQLADAFRAAHPAGRGILLTARTAAALDGALTARPWLRFASKAADYDELHALVHEIVDAALHPVAA